MNRSVPIQERAGQVFLIDGQALLVLGRGVSETWGPYVPAWSMLELDTLRQIIMSEDWVDAQDRLGCRVRP